MWSNWSLSPCCHYLTKPLTDSEYSLNIPPSRYLLHLEASPHQTMRRVYLLVLTGDSLNPLISVIFHVHHSHCSTHKSRQTRSASVFPPVPDTLPSSHHRRHFRTSNLRGKIAIVNLLSTLLEALCRPPLLFLRQLRRIRLDQS